MSLLPQLNLPWWLSHQSPAEVSWCSPPPVILSRTAHRTRTHTRHTDPNGTRDTHTEPHGTSTRDAHTMFSSLHIEPSYVCGIVSCLISPVGYGVCMLATSVNSGAVPHGHLGTRHEHADNRTYRLTQSSWDPPPESSYRTFALPLSRLAHLGPS